MVYLFDVGGQSVFEYFMEVFTFAKSLLVLFDGVRHAKAYKSYYDSIKIIRSHCLNKQQYAKTRKILTIKCCTSITALVIAFLVFVLSGLAACLLGNGIESGGLFFWPIVFKVAFYTWIDVRYIYEHLVAYCIIIEIYDLMKILNDSVTEDLDLYSMNADNFICMNDIEEEESSEALDKENIWRESYENILKCSKHISRCFGELVILFRNQFTCLFVIQFDGTGTLWSAIFFAVRLFGSCGRIPYCVGNIQNLYNLHAKGNYDIGGSINLL